MKDMSTFMGIECHALRLNRCCVILSSDFRANTAMIDHRHSAGGDRSGRMKGENVCFRPSCRIPDRSRSHLLDCWREGEESGKAGNLLGGSTHKAKESPSGLACSRVRNIQTSAPLVVHEVIPYSLSKSWEIAKLRRLWMCQWRFRIRTL